MSMVHPSATTLVALVAQVYLGSVFMCAAAGKLAHPREFIDATLEYRLLPAPLGRLLGALLPGFELVVAVCLLLDIGGKLAGVAALVLLLCFITAITVNLRRGRAIPCSCFKPGGNNTIGWGTVGRNVFLLTLAILTVSSSPQAAAPDGWRLDGTVRLFLTFPPSVQVSFLLMLISVAAGIAITERVLDVHQRSSALR